MSLRFRTVLTIGLIFLGLILVLYRILSHSYEAIETETTLNNIERFRNVLDNEYSTLSDTCGDWACWDDTYHYIEDRNPDYVENYLTNASLAQIRVDLMVFANASGEVVLTRFIDSDTEEDRDMPPALPEHFTPSSPLLRHASLESVNQGLLLLPGITLLLVSRPVLTSQEQGPARGTLVLGRILDESLINRWASLTQLSIRTHRIGEAELPADFARAESALQANPTAFVSPLSSVEIAGYTRLQDLYNRPALLVRLVKSRYIYTKGLSTIHSLIGVFFLIGLIFCALAVALLEKMIHSRLTHLGHEIQSIEQSGDLSKRLAARGRDELALLARKINRMLESLELFHKQLAESQDLLETTQEVAHIGSWKWNLETQDWVWSKEALRISGMSKFDGRADTFFQNVHPEDLPKVRSAVRQSINLEKPFHLDHRILSPDGTVRWVSQQAEVLSDDEGRLCLIGTIRNITEQKTNDQEKQRLEEQLRRAQKMDAFGQLAAGIAHNFNNLLTAVLGNIFLAMREAPPDVYAYLEIADASGRKAADLVKNLLFFSSSVAAVKSPVDLRDVVEETVKIVSSTFDKRIKIRVEHGPDLPPVLGDAGQLHQVLLNLCINARDALESVSDRTPILRIWTAAAPAEEGLFVELLVSDNGTGMDPEVQKRMFDPFFTTKEKGKGTGLGLSTVYGIVNQHNGIIRVESEPGVGTVFRIVLPAGQAEETRAASGPTAKPARGMETLLLIDDEATVRRFMDEFLTQFGYTVITAPDGEEGLRIFERDHDLIDLVILDLSLPKLPGAAVLKRILACHPAARVIICSGYSSDTQDLEGAMAFCRKPIQISEFLLTLRRVFLIDRASSFPDTDSSTVS